MAADRREGRLSRLGGRWRPNPETLAGVFVLGLLGGTFAWWALKYGAYFGAVMYPGVALMGAGTAVLLGAAPWRASLALSTSVRIALGALLALAGWSLASALWSPTPDIAIEDAQRIVGYAIAFGLGIWSCVLLERRMELAVLPVVCAAGAVAVITLIVLAAGSEPSSFLDEDGTLEYPLGYRNATAAFFLIAFWPAICLASSPRVSVPVRAVAFVLATGCFEVAVLCQSRGAILGFLAGAVVLFLSSPARLASVTRLTAVLPAIPTFFVASDLFEAAKGNGLGQTLGEMHTAGIVGLAGIAVSIPLAVFVVRFEPPERSLNRSGSRRDRWRAAGALAAAVVVLVALVGNPVSWAGDRVSEFLGGEADLSEESDRFTFNAGSNRSELWRVAVDVAEEDPVFGEGGGGYRFRYTRERRNPGRHARDAHSVELEMLSELGAVGLALFAAATIGAFAGAIRARRLGPAAAMLSTGALAGGAYWLAHASVDWFWPYPAVTAPALALLGAAAAPALVMPERKSLPRSRRPLMIAIVVFVVTLIPPFLSDRLVNHAIGVFSDDPEQAYDDLALARDLNPLTDTPALREGSIALALGDRQRAIAAYSEAIRKRPEEYAGHFFLALLYSKSDPEAARSSLAVVAELNPLEPRLDEIRERIEAAERDEADTAAKGRSGR